MPIKSLSYSVPNHFRSVISVLGYITQGNLTYIHEYKHNGRNLEGSCAETDYPPFLRSHNCILDNELGGWFIQERWHKPVITDSIDKENAYWNIGK